MDLIEGLASTLMGLFRTQISQRSLKSREGLPAEHHDKP